MAVVVEHKTGFVMQVTRGGVGGGVYVKGETRGRLLQAPKLVRR